MVEFVTLGSTGEVVEGLQRALNEKMGLRLTADGVLGRITQSSLEAFQAKNGIAEKGDKGAYYGAKTQALLQPYIESRFIQIADLADAAKQLSCELAMVRAITKVEAKEFGFFKGGFPVILFERHKFYKYLSESRGLVFAQKQAALRGDICNPSQGGYLGNEAEIKRLEAAIAIDERAALMSASWGLFQLMGFNFRLCGYQNVESMVEQMKASEDYQLQAFINFVKNQPALLNAIREKNFLRTAELYNGAGQVGYDKRLKDAYDYFVRNPGA